MAYSAYAFSTNILVQVITQAHTFVIGDIVRYNGTTYVKAQADSETNAAVVGMVFYVPDANHFYLTQEGYVKNIAVAKVSGSLYYLDPANAGELTVTKPTTPGEQVVPLFIADSTTSGYFFANAGYPAGTGGGSGANTALSNLIATAINQNLTPGIDDNIDLGAFDKRYSFVYPIAINTGHTPGDFYALTAYNTNTNVDTTFATATAGNPPTFELEPNVTGSTQAPGTNDTTLATTAFVQAAVSGGTGANQTLSNLTNPTAVNQALIPGTVATLDLGTPANAWRDLYGETFLSAQGNGDPLAIAVWDIGLATYNPILVAQVGNPSVATLTSFVTAVTQSNGTNTTQIATCAFVQNNSANRALSNLSSVAINAALAPNADNTLDVGTTTLRWNNIFANRFSSGTTLGDSVSLNVYDTGTGTFKSLISATVGNPATATITDFINGTTQPPGTSNTTLATTAFVQAALTGGSVVPSSRTITIAGTANEITSSAGAQDLSVNRTWTLSLPAALTFTGKTITGGAYSGASATTFTFTSGTIGAAVTGVTQTPLTNNTTIATTAYVDAAVGSSVTATVEVTGTSQAMAVGTTYIMNNVGLVTGTLPTTAAQGSRIRVLGKGAGGWRVAQNASQAIQLGAVVTTTGTGGSISSTNQWDGLELVCLTANTGWAAYPLIGNFTTV